MNFTSLAWVLSLSLSAMGCNAILGIDDFKDQAAGGGGSGAEGGNGGTNPTTTTTTGAQGGTGAAGAGPTTTSASGGTGGSLPTCDNGGVCIPSVPGGWTGPVAVFSASEGTQVPGCAGAYGTGMTTMHEGIIEGSATCSCRCDPAQGIACTTGANMCAAATCNTLCNTTTATLQPNVYTSISMSTLANAHISNPAPTNVGSCQAQPNHAIQSPTWTNVVKACGGATTMPTGCGGAEVCAPSPAAPFDKICVAAPGEQACPANYTEQHVVHESFSDDRRCSSCSCGGANSTCGGSAVFTASSGMVFLSEVNAGTCGPKNVGGTYASGATYSPAPSGTCVAGGGTLSGAVATQGTLTYCCLP